LLNLLKPTATFTNSSGSVVVTFTNTSLNAQTFYWQFGDGTTSTDSLPVHTYAVAGRYNVTLKTASAAGYSATVTKTVLAAAPVAASFTVVSSLGLNVVFNNSSTAVDVTAANAVVWDFGDNTTSTVLSPTHKYPAFGNYTVKLTVIGLLGDTATTSQLVSVNNRNLLQGGGMETADGVYWSVWSSQNNITPEFGYTGDKPSGGSGGCLSFPSYSNGSGSTNELIYQPVLVEKGAQYKLSAQVKLPGGGSQVYLQFYITTDPNTWVETAQGFLMLNTWHGWGSQTASVPVDGDLATLVSQYGMYGFGAATGGVYTATATGTVYIGIQAGTWAGYSNGNFLVDNVSFEQVF
jgi:PKD repeat protein